MTMYLLHSWRMAALLFAATALAGTATAVTVVVDGTGGTSGKYATLSEAVNFTNGQGAGPHTINIETASITDGGFVAITQPVTINGKGTAGTVPCDVLVDISALTGGASGLAYYIRVASEGDVVIRDLNIHPDETGLASIPIGAVETDNPAIGMGNYLIENVHVSGTNGTSFINPVTDASLYDDASSILWVPAPAEDSGEGGIVRVANTSGTLSAVGDYDVTLDHCNVALGVGLGLNIDGRSNNGKTTVLGGFFGHVARYPIVAQHGSHNVFIRGTYEDRIKLVRANYGNSGAGFGAFDTSTIDMIEYTDSYLHQVNCWGINIGNNATVNMKHCRIWHGTDPDGALPTGGRLIRTPNNATLNAESCTFFIDNCANTNGDTNVNHDLQVLITDAGGSHDGLLTFTNCVFASDGPAGPNVDGYFNMSGTGPYTFINCAIPTDDYAQENLRLPPDTFYPPTSATPPANVDQTNTVSVSPHFASITYDVTDPSNANFLLPTDTAYNTAASNGAKLVGGVGIPTVAGIEDWMLMEM